MLNCEKVLARHEELQDIIFQIEHRGLRVEARLSCVIESGLSVEIIAPPEMAGLEAHCCHIPAFAYPPLRGYLYKGALTAKAMTCIQRVLALRIDTHLFLLAHGNEVRRIFKKAASRVYKRTMKNPSI